MEPAQCVPGFGLGQRSDWVGSEVRLGWIRGQIGLSQYFKEVILFFIICSGVLLANFLYSLRKRIHDFALPPKDDRKFFNRVFV